HRLSGVLVGFVFLALLIMAWRYYRTNKLVVWSATVGFLLVFAAGILGGLTVLTGLTWWVRLIHLAIAELVVASAAITFLSSASRSVDPLDSVVERGESTPSRVWLTWAMLGGVFILILYGSYIVGQGFGSSCSSWPLCQGSVFPSGQAYIEHMGHRYLSLIVGGLIVAVAYFAWSHGNRYSELRWLAVISVSVLMAQILVGAVLVWTGFSTELKAIHVTMATLSWLSVVVLAAVYLAPRRFMIESQSANTEGAASW
ncbi:MAG: COX15/CtaA family protein, partial [Chloroflexi bacterium]|nr:COX15/CtaA family protein [Chloroflexota bacterium]